jgi:hypothetical protein
MTIQITYPATIAFHLSKARRQQVLDAAAELGLRVTLQENGREFIVIVPDAQAAYDLGLLSAKAQDKGQ